MKPTMPWFSKQTYDYDISKQHNFSTYLCDLKTYDMRTYKSLIAIFLVLVILSVVAFLKFVTPV